MQVTNVFPLAEAGRAHALSQQGHGRGRIVLHVADQDRWSMHAADQESKSGIQQIKRQAWVSLDLRIRPGQWRSQYFGPTQDRLGV